MSAEITEKIISFIRSIGIGVERKKIEEETFLPGILIDRGNLVIDEEKLLHPGDLLHEAGHIAVIIPEDRLKLYNTVLREDISKSTEGAEEMAAIAWSYAALVHLQLAPEILFHETGYKGGSASLIENFTGKRYIGVPILEWIGLCNYNHQHIAANKTDLYPQMVKWMRT